MRTIAMLLSVALPLGCYAERVVVIVPDPVGVRIGGGGGGPGFLTPRQRASLERPESVSLATMPTDRQDAILAAATFALRAHGERLIQAGRPQEHQGLLSKSLRMVLADPLPGMSWPTADDVRRYLAAGNSAVIVADHTIPCRRCGGRKQAPRTDGRLGVETCPACTGTGIDTQQVAIRLSR